MATMDVFNADEFSLTSLTEKAAKAPHVETALARIFETSSIATETGFIDRGESGLELVQTSARNAVSPASNLGLSRKAIPVSSVKIGKLVTLSPTEIQNTRAFGTESEVETMELAYEQKEAPVRNSIDYTHEYQRLGAVKGVQLDADGTTVLNNFYASFGITKPDDIELKLDETSPAPGAIRKRFRNAKRVIRDALGDIASKGVMLLAGADVFDGLTDHPELRDAYARWQDGAWLRQDSLQGFTYEGIEIVEYRGAGLAANEARFVPVGVPGMFKTIFTPADHMEVSNTMGRPLYVFPNLKDFGKGFESEVVSCPIHFCARPEALLGAVAGSATGGL